MNDQNDRNHTQVYEESSCILQRPFKLTDQLALK
jgi:hypothetical protein